jgi:hypothetical protein
MRRCCHFALVVVSWRQSRVVLRQNSISSSSSGRRWCCCQSISRSSIAKMISAVPVHAASMASISSSLLPVVSSVVPANLVTATATSRYNCLLLGVVECWRFSSWVYHGLYCRRYDSLLRKLHLRLRDSIACLCFISNNPSCILCSAAEDDAGVNSGSGASSASSSLYSSLT